VTPQSRVDVGALWNIERWFGYSATMFQFARSSDADPVALPCVRGATTAR
jgi:hypothetical protein